MWALIVGKRRLFIKLGFLKTGGQQKEICFYRFQIFFFCLCVSSKNHFSNLTLLSLSLWALGVTCSPHFQIILVWISELKWNINQKMDLLARSISFWAIWLTNISSWACKSHITNGKILFLLSNLNCHTKYKFYLYSTVVHYTILCMWPTSSLWYCAFQSAELQEAENKIFFTSSCSQR